MVKARRKTGSSVMAALARSLWPMIILSDILYRPEMGSLRTTGKLTLVMSYPIDFLIIFQIGTGSSTLRKGSLVLLIASSKMIEFMKLGSRTLWANCNY